MVVSKYQQIIDNSFKLQKNGSHYLIEEKNNNAKNKSLRVYASHSMAFSLDQNIKGEKNWAFLSSTPPKGITSVSDAIIVAEFQKKSYILVLDMKSKVESNAQVQIKSSYYLCNWLNSLIKLHMKGAMDIIIIGVICQSGRNTPAKGKTEKAISPYKSALYENIKIHNIHNPGSISIEQIINW